MFLILNCMKWKKTRVLIRLNWYFGYKVSLISRHLTTLLSLENTKNKNKISSGQKKNHGKLAEIHHQRQSLSYWYGEKIFSIFEIINLIIVYFLSSEAELRFEHGKNIEFISRWKAPDQNARAILHFNYNVLSFIDSNSHSNRSNKVNAIGMNVPTYA